MYISCNTAVLSISTCLTVFSSLFCRRCWWKSTPPTDKIVTSATLRA